MKGGKQRRNERERDREKQSVGSDQSNSHENFVIAIVGDFH